MADGALFWAGCYANKMMAQPLWREVRALYPTSSFGFPAWWPSLMAHLCLVCSTSHLPASSVFHLVWEPGWLAWKHHHLEALHCLSHLPHHALPLHWLLAGAQVPGKKNKMSDTLLCVLEVYRGLGAGAGVTKLPDCGKRKGRGGHAGPWLGKRSRFRRGW